MNEDADEFRDENENGHDYVDNSGERLTGDMDDSVSEYAAGAD